MEDYGLAMASVLCTNAACENNAERIELLVEREDPHVTCGACAQLVTDIVPVQ